MKAKTFKTLDEQIEILLQKGLVIDDIEEAKNILLRENYFFLSGYRHLFLKSRGDRNFKEGTNFKEIYSLFSFDRQLRNIIFKNILIVENNLKSILAYIMSKNHGFKENNYLNPHNFIQKPERKRQVNDLIRKMKRQISVNGKQHSATAHFIDIYGYIPLWVVVKVLSFGIVGELYTILQYQDQKEIADAFHIDTYSLAEYLPILANYRNLCAHEDTKYHHLLNIAKDYDEYVYGKNDLFALIIMLKQILNSDNFNLLMYEIGYELDILSGHLKTIKIESVLDSMGFPENYKEIVRL